MYVLCGNINTGINQSINQSINHGNDLIFVGFTLTSIFFGPSRFPHKDTVRDVIIYESPHDLLILYILCKIILDQCKIIHYSFQISRLNKINHEQFQFHL
jgi:hypothetical protein